MIVEHFGSDKLQPIMPVKNARYSLKPAYGGLWTSPIDSDYTWQKWCINESFSLDKLKKSFRLNISVDNLLVIDSIRDFEECIVKNAARKTNIGGGTVLLSIDYEALSQRYDGIWLTGKGLIETRRIQPLGLFSWDCETVLLFNEHPIIEVIK